MERDRRPSRLAAPLSLLGRRRPGISITEPVGLSLKHQRVAEPSDDERHPAQNLGDTDQSIVSDFSTGNMSNIVHCDGVEHFTRPTTPIVTQLEISSPNWPLPKSCTLHSFPGLPKPLSPPSLISGRRVDTSSSMSSFSGATNTSLRSTSRSSHASHIPVHTSTRWSLGSSKNAQQHVSRDPYIVYDAQPSAYWTGRFVGLRDKLQSESLVPRNMQSLLHAHTEHAAAVNHQERERRKIQRNKNNDNHHYPRFNTRLPPSATSGAILQRETSGGRRLTDAALLLDDDERCRKVFVHLEAFCATDEARKSLRLWQQDYARKTGRKKLLPEGGSMDERAVGSYLTRIIGGRRMGKRTSVM